MKKLKSLALLSGVVLITTLAGCKQEVDDTQSSSVDSYRLNLGSPTILSESNKYGAVKADGTTIKFYNSEDEVWSKTGSSSSSSNSLMSVNDFGDSEDDYVPNNNLTRAATVDGKWTSGDVVAIQMYDEVKYYYATPGDATNKGAYMTYQSEPDGTVELEHLFKDKNTTTVESWMPASESAKADFEISEDQSTYEKLNNNDFIYGSTSAKAGVTSSIQYQHKMARLHVNVKKTSEVTSKSQIQVFTVGQGDMPLLCTGLPSSPTASSSVKGSITPCEVTCSDETNYVASYECLVPGNVNVKGVKLFYFEVDGEHCSYVVPGDLTFKAGYTYYISVDAEMAKITLQKTEVTVGNSSGNTVSIPGNSLISWTATTSGAGFSISPETGNGGDFNITVKATKNSTDYNNVTTLGSVIINSGSKTAVVTVKQAKAEPYLNADDITISGENGATGKIKVSSSSSWWIESVEHTWSTYTNRGSDAKVEKSGSYIIVTATTEQDNNYNFPICKITISNGKLTKTVTVTQNTTDQSVCGVIFTQNIVIPYNPGTTYMCTDKINSDDALTFFLVCENKSHYDRSLYDVMTGTCFTIDLVNNCPGFTILQEDLSKLTYYHTIYYSLDIPEIDDSKFNEKGQYECGRLKFKCNWEFSHTSCLNYTTIFFILQKSIVR